MIALRFLALFVAFLATSTTVLRVSAADEEVTAECTNQNEALMNTTEYETAYAGIVSGFEAVEAGTGEGNTCQDEDDYMQCIGSINATAIAEFETACTMLDGQVVELENVRITCTPDSGMRTFTNVELIPMCVGSVCNEDDIGLLTEKFLEELDEDAEESSGPKTCVADDGGDFPAGTLSGALPVHPILVAVVSAVAGMALAL